MKMNKVIIGVTALLIAIYAFTFGYINQTDMKKVDVTKINTSIVY